MKKLKRSGGLSGVLARQKPRSRRRGSTSLKLKARLMIAMLVVLVVLGGVSILLKSRFGASMRTFAQRKQTVVKPEWQIHIRSDDGALLSEDTITRALAATKNSLGDGSQANLETVAKAVQQSGVLSFAHVIKTEANVVVVSIRQRSPLLSIHADRPRFVSKEGIVYGELSGSNPDLAQSLGPTLSGIFDNRAQNFSFRDDGSLNLTPEEKVLVDEGVMLFLEGRDLKYDFKSIEYKRFRGFFVVLPTSETEVSVGRAPFREKLVRLRDILAKLEKSGSQAARIELDYQGKAFIKEKKL